MSLVRIRNQGISENITDIILEDLNGNVVANLLRNSNNIGYMIILHFDTLTDMNRTFNSLPECVKFVNDEFRLFQAFQ